MGVGLYGTLSPAHSWLIVHVDTFMHVDKFMHVDTACHDILAEKCGESPTTTSDFSAVAK